MDRGGDATSPPGALDTAIFNTSVVNGPRGARIAAATFIGGLVFNNTGTTGIAASTSAKKALEIGAGGITMASTAGAVTFGTGSRPMTVRLGASQTWLNSSSALLSHINGATDTDLDLAGYTLQVDGTGPTTFASGAMLGSAATAVIKNGTGVLTFNVKDRDATTVGNATFTGDVQLNGGTVRYAVASALPSTADVTFNTPTGIGTAALDLNGFSGTIKSLTIDGAAGTGAAVTTGLGTLTLGGNVTYNSPAGGTPDGATITGKLDLGAATRTFEIKDSAVTDEELRVSAEISGTGVGLTKASTGALILNGLNNFDGPLVVREGILSVNTLVGVGTGVIQLGYGTRTGILRYTGEEASTDRQIQLGRTTAAEVGGGVIENNGTGKLTFSNTPFFNSTLAVTGAATIHLGTGAVLAFADSSDVNSGVWSGTLNITGILGATSIRFGTDNAGLTEDQLDLISVNGSGAGTYTLDSLGYLVSGAVSGYAAWQAANNTTQNADLDHDHDGVSNGVEFFLGGTGNTTGFTTPLPGVTHAAGTLSVTWVRHPDYPGFPGNYGSAFVVETSATLAAPWTPAIEGVGADQVEITGNTVKYTFPAGANNFARLKVVTIP